MIEALPISAGGGLRWQVVTVAVAGLAFGLAAGMIRSNAVQAFTLAGFFAVLTAISAIDLQERRIPNVLTYPGIAIAIALAVLTGAGLQALGGLLLSGGLMAAFWLVGRGQLGLGDVKLSAFVGAVLGLEAAPTYLLLGTLAGATAALVSLILRRNRRATLAYGPFLVIGAVGTALLHGSLVA